MRKIKNDFNLNYVIIISLALYVCLDLYIGGLGFLPYWMIKSILIAIDALLCFKTCLMISQYIKVSLFEILWLFFFFIILLSMIMNDSIYVTTILRWSVILLLLLLFKGKEKEYYIAANIFIINGVVQSIGVFLELFFYDKWWPLINVILSKSGEDIYQNIIRSQKDVNYLSGFTHNAGFTATYIVNAIFAVIFIKDKVKKTTYYLLIGILGISLVMTGKRGQLLILMIAFAIVYILKADNVRKGIIACIKVAFILTIIYIVGYILYFTLDSGNNVLYRVLRLIYDNSSNDKSSGRYELWSQAIAEFKNNYLLGIGWLNYDLKYGLEVHNTYLQVLCEGGLLGMGAFILAMISTFLNSFKLAKKNFNEPINYVTFFYLIYFFMFGIVENAAINVEPLFMLFFLMTSQINYNRDLSFKSNKIYLN